MQAQRHRSSGQGGGPTRPVGRETAKAVSRTRRAAIAAPLVIVSTLGLALADGASAASANLVVNPGFESGTVGWTVATGTTLTSATGRTGKYSGLVTNRSGVTRTLALNDAKNSVVSTIAGHTYEVGAWVRTSSPNMSTAVRVMEYAGSTYRGEGKGSAWLTSTSWQRVTTKYRAVSTGATLDLNVLAWQVANGRSLQVDDVTLVDLSVPAATATTTATPSPSVAPTASIAPTASVTPTTSATSATSVPVSSTSTTTSPTSTTAPTTLPGWRLVWADEFNVSGALNSTSWNTENYSTYGEGNLELACLMNRPENVTQSAGNLHIRAQREATPIKCGSSDARFPNGRSYTSGHVTTKNKQSWTYGRFEIRAKLPTAQGTSKGLWPAFWLRPVDGGTGELDIMEAIGSNATGTEWNKIHQTLWYDYNGTYPRQAYAATMSWGQPSDGYHTYAVEWEKGEIRWYIDGRLTYTRNLTTTPWMTSAFSRPFYMRLNLAVGGTWPGSPDSATTFPADYAIDYVKVYQR